MTTRLWIKGTPLSAIMAARQHGIVVTNFQNDTLPMEDPSFVLVADVSVEDSTPDYAGRIVQWYSEPSAPQDGIGYPEGTLLFFHLAL